MSGLPLYQPGHEFPSVGSTSGFFASDGEKMASDVNLRQGMAHLSGGELGVN